NVNRHALRHIACGQLDRMHTWLVTPFDGKYNSSVYGGQVSVYSQPGCLDMNRSPISHRIGELIEDFCLNLDSTHTSNCSLTRGACINFIRPTRYRFKNC